MSNKIRRFVLYKWVDTKNKYSISQLKDMELSMLHIFDDFDDILLVHVYFDYEPSFRHALERPAFKRMLSELKKDRIDVIVVSDLSSISNDPFEISHCIDFLNSEYDIDIFDASVDTNDSFVRKRNDADILSVTMPFDSSYKMLDTIKLAALYFDRINIICPMFDEKTPYFSERIFNHLNVLIQSDIVVPQYRSIFSDNFMDDSEVIELACQGIAGDDSDDCLSLMKNSRIREYLADSCPDDDNSFVKWFMMATNNQYLQNSFQLTTILDTIYSRENSAASYAFANSLYNRIARQNQSKNSGCVAIEAAGLLLPNFINNTFEDILNVRLKAKDELAEMKSYIDCLSTGYDFDSAQSLTEYVKRKVNKDISDFNKKIRDGRLDLVNKFIDEFKDPLTYTPLLTSFFNGISQNIAAAASCGIITLRTAVQYIRMKEEIKSNPLYFRTKI